MKKNVNICEVFCTSAPALMGAQKAFTAHRQKGYIFLRGRGGSDRAALVQILLKQALTFTLRVLKDAGAGGEWSSRPSLFPESEVGGFKNGRHSMSAS